MKFWMLKEHNNFSYRWKFEPDTPNTFVEIFFEKIYKECVSSLTIRHPVIQQFLVAVIFFVTDCKELKLAQIV